MRLFAAWGVFGLLVMAGGIWMIQDLGHALVLVGGAIMILAIFMAIMRYLNGPTETPFGKRW